MRVGVLRLRRSVLAVAVPVVLATILLGSFAVGNPPPQPRGGVFPTPGMGPPGAVAAFGAIVPPSGPPMPVMLPQPAPLVAAKFLVPQGTRVTAFPGTKLSKMFDSPVTLGLRPGYVYRFELTNLPYQPGKSLFPEVEVHGTLVPRPGMKYMDYALPILFTLEDIERVMNGALITKVIYLEDPEKAIPAEIQPDAPVEIPENTEREALKAARDNGRFMAIVRLGDRKPPAEVLNFFAVNGTILFPGETYLKAPVLPPVIPFYACPMYDPILGPKGPKEECFVNGDDKLDPLGIGRDQKLGGLNPTDVGVEYSVGDKRRVTTSSMACICSPRYVIRRAELLPGGVEIRLKPAANIAEWSPSWLKERQVPMVDIGREKPNEYVGRTRPMAYIGKVGTSFFVGTSKPMAIGQVEGVKIEGALVEPEQLTAYPVLCPLTVTKVVDPPGPKQPGDIVTITIRYANTGAKAISDIVVSDSLSGRLEYVPLSAETDRAGNFSSFDNEVGSLILRWEIPGTILPGQAGTIRFKTKVR